MDAATLSKAMNHSLNIEQYRALVDGANDCLRRCECFTIDRAAMLLAQVGTESLGLKFSQEIHDGSNYEGRLDLGNTQPGDGKRFRGRGYIQCTGRANYGQVSRWLNARGYVPTANYFLDHPTQLGELRFAWLTVIWYWQTRGLNSYADRKDIVGATRVIQGASGGLDDRRFRYGRCLALGKAILPSDDVELPMDRKELERIIDNRSRRVARKAIRNAIFAYHQGEQPKPGWWTRARFPGWIKDKDHGMGDRVYRLEQKK